MGVTFTEKAAKRIADAVRKLEQQPRDRSGSRNTTRITEHQFWGMIMGCDISGVRFTFLRVIPDFNADDFDVFVDHGDNGLKFKLTGEEPEVGYAREINSIRGVPPFSVVLMTFAGYDS